MNKSDFLQALSEIKIKGTKSCLVHVSLIDLGLFQGIKISKINDFIFKSLKKYTSKNCTISTLTPFYEYADKKKEFDIKKSVPSKEIGDFSRFIFSKRNSYRSHNPLFNISSIGPLAKKITQKHSASAFGKNSSWESLYNYNSDMIFIGCDLSRCTFIRYIEHKFGVPYLINKTFNTKIKSNGRILHLKSSSTLRNLKINVKYKTEKFENILKKKGFLRINSNTNFKIMALKMKPALGTGIDCLKKNLYFFINKRILK